MKKLLLVHLFLLVGICAFAQVPAPAQMQQMKVENLSDDEIRQLVAEMKRNKISFDQIDLYAQQKSIPASEVIKLKDRIRNLNLENELAAQKKTGTEEAGLATERAVNDGTVISAKDIQPMTVEEQKRAKIFGTELFSNKNLTFEPNLRMPTPPNYKLAADDEVVIDVYGYSEVQHKLKVSPEGYIRIPYLGPVYVNGLTMEEAKSRITKQLATIYGGIKLGNTFVQVSLGSIRSINVLLIGEVVRPGTYTMPSLATVANALYVSGGPNENGSFREIQVIRNGQLVSTFDLYDFLNKGDLTNNIVLQDQDIVKVNAYKTRVELTGEIKHPAIFEVKESETLANVIGMAGGYSDMAYKDIIRAYRISKKEREVINIPASEVSTFLPRSGDKYLVEAVLNRFSNRVVITGAVFHPGVYALEKGMTVNDLIRMADGIKEDASTSRALIFRKNDDLSPAATSFSLKDVLHGSQVILLKREDSVVVYSKAQQKENLIISINGEVNNPGTFFFTDSLHIEDLIMMAGGLRDAASLKRIEVARRIRGREYNPKDSAIAIVAQFDISADLSGLSNFTLQPFDHIIVRRSPTYSPQSSIIVEGEVVYPGSYIINSKRERISDVIARSGGLRPEAYPEGAILIRKTYTNSSDSALIHSKLEVFYNKLDDSTAMRKIAGSMGKEEQLVGIDLKRILKQKNSKYDLFLEEGDIIRIPKMLQTVQLIGEIYFPKKVRYDPKITFRDYIRGAGGFTSNALKRRSYVVYANGEIKSTRNILFFKQYPKINPGAEIYVPSRKSARKLTGQEAIGITTGIASLALIIVSVIDLINK